MIDPKALPAPLQDPKIPAWLPGAASDLIRVAEVFIPGPSRGPERKEWVVRNLRELARKHDIKQVPDWIETPLEDFLIGVIVEGTFSLLKRANGGR